MRERVETMSEQSDSTTSEPDGSYEEYQEEEEEIVEMSEEELLKMLDSQEPALQVCSRLFHNAQLQQSSFKVLSHAQIMQLQSDGYLIINNCLTAAASQQLHSEALQLHAAGSLEQAAKVGLLPDMSLDKLTDVSARGDCITWLHGATLSDGADSAAGRAVAILEELQQDLHLVMNLEQRSAEYQLAVYAGRGSQYVKHRDALPDDGSNPNQRRVTAILYANPGWQEEHGGQLRIWLPLSSTTSRLPHGCERQETALEQCQQSAPGPQRLELQLLHQQPAAEQHEGGLQTTALEECELTASGSHLSGPNPEQHQAASERCQQQSLSGAQRSQSTLDQQQGASDNGQQHGQPNNWQQLAAVDNPGQRSVSAVSLSNQSADGECDGDQSSEAASLGQAEDGEQPGRQHDAGQEQQLGMAGLKIQSQSQGQARHTLEQQHSGGHFGHTQGEPTVDIDPLPGRLVVFLSGAIDHAVLPSHQPRVALTAWCR